MTRIICLAVFAAALSAATLQAQEESTAPPTPPPCSDPEYRHFDFWLGDWDVSNQLAPPEQRAKARNRISSQLGGCAIREEYEAVGPRGTLTGTSINFYDKSRGTWRQLWIDNQGRPLELEGGLEGKSMILKSPDGKQKVTWTPLEGGKVRQLWEASQDGGETWTAVFDGIYSPR